MTIRNSDLPKMEDLIVGRIYKLESRNLSYGVWNGKGGFVGIRTKYQDHFLDTEYHWDMNSNWGTVSMAKDTQIDVPDGIPLDETINIFDYLTNRPIFYKNPDCGWVFADTEESNYNIRPVSQKNIALFNFWKSILKKTLVV